MGKWDMGIDGVLQHLYTIDGWDYYLDHEGIFYARKDNVRVKYHMILDLIKKSINDEEFRKYIHNQTIQSADRLINSTLP